MRFLILFINQTYFCSTSGLMDRRASGYNLEFIAAGCSVLACHAERGRIKLKGVLLQMGFKAWQHTHPICCNLLFCLPWSAANSLLLSRGPKLRPHGAAYCLHTICSCFRDVRRPQFALFCRLFAIIAWRFIFILEFIHKPFKALTAILVLTGEVKRRTDASFRVLIRCFSNKLARVIYNLALPAVFGTAWVLEVLRGRIN